VDVAAGAAINAWTDREPNDVGETEREEFEQAVEDYGDESLGKVEAPAWIVLVICLIALILSKYIGAARKPEPKPEPKPAPPALVVATPALATANGAVAEETEATATPAPTTQQTETAEPGNGSAPDAQSIF
jgi:hypothetical protein